MDKEKFYCWDFLFLALLPSNRISKLSNISHKKALGCSPICKLPWTCIKGKSCSKAPVGLAPCIMCVQYRGGCSVPWGVLSTVGGVQYRGGYHEYRGGYHEYRGGYLEYRGGCSVLWGIS